MQSYIDLSIIIEAYHNNKIVKKIIKNIKHPIGYRLEQSIQCVLNNYVESFKINIFTTYTKKVKILSLFLAGVAS